MAQNEKSPLQGLQSITGKEQQQYTENFDISKVEKFFDADYQPFDPEKCVDVTNLGTPEKTTFTGEELFNLNADKIPCLIGDIIPKIGLFGLAGSSDTGKSMWFRQLIICLVKGIPFCGWPIDSIYGKGIFVATEDDQIATSYLLRRQAQSPDNLKNIRFHFDTDNIPDYLRHELSREPADLVIIDAWSDVFGQNLNDSALIRTTLNEYRSIANTYKCAIGFLHHTGKRTEKLAPSKNNILSGQGFEAKMRLVMELRNDPHDSYYKHLCVVKGNYLSKEYKETSYKLKLDPETFTFSDTGERVPFEELTEAVEIGERKQPLMKAHELDSSSHLEVLREVFEGGLKLKLSDLRTRLANKYEAFTGTTFGERRVKQYLDYLMNDLGLIAKSGKDKSPNAYYYLTTDDITDDVKKCRL